MTITEPQRSTPTNPIAEVRAWLTKNWDPDLTVAEWWQLLGISGWAAPVLPAEAFGLGLSRADSVAVMREIGAFGALGPPSGLGLLLAAPTIATHGTTEQIDNYIRDIVTGQQAWCQLFSEPGAGSDLAGLTTRAERDGDEWIVNGQKVWTSLGQTADMGMLIARTNVDVPKHQGISWMAIDMHQPGVEIRPLHEMTGHAMFNEVFLTDARVPVDAVIGDINNGWAATNTTLQAERAGLGAGGSGGAAGAQPGTIAKQLERRAGDLVPAKSAAGTKKSGDKNANRRAVNRPNQTLLIDFAQSEGKIGDPTVRQDLMRLHTLNVVGGLNAQRLKGMRSAGKDIPGMANISKLMMSDVVRLSRDVGLGILGAAGTLHAYTAEQRESLNAATGNPLLGMITGQALYAQAPPIYGGTDQIQKNIIGERVLGLPKEPNNDKVLPFSELPKNV
ncbi:MAG: acyl-CoA dehydrogenase [Ilumatobacter sp.]|mgnify:CR=1 FL=1|jgi:alkylation response protein AidB-like acyl-CoA dehydrogenase|uniref:acyl-CoA dehydrogenase family protein n=1 Tax=Ilumatobacter sp. TaxID=1967498 RepID=UPI001D32A12E|nr:acyl-CoA dehydrogenase [Ilumatobacter sp.]MBT5275564.1 acyl-CoA dehydrogenase [Ilumatobacter sp.]MBT5554870.1 acyl-CoA dehydrogenase [Ilumatobacter sp.]MBT5866833.1 acyl-CoA dehydrogenase [Ilumatobacter sp.]MBT7431211.1 acyl-CoA dehydrogenase [Ilumatobacter sp.]